MVQIKKRLIPLSMAFFMALLLALLPACAAETPTPDAAPTITITPDATPSATPTPVLTLDPNMDEAQKANRIAQAMFDGEYELIGNELAEAPLAQVQEMGGMAAFALSLIMQTGKFLSLDGEAELYTVSDGIRYYTAPITAQNGKYIMQIGLDTAGKIMGLSVALAPEEPIAMPADFDEIEVMVDAGEGYPLEGRLVVPKAADTPPPVVLLIQGSGATDYDEIVGANRVFGKLARGLAQQGIATLRYTKRTFAYPQVSAMRDYSIQTEYVEDVLAAVELLKGDARVDAQRIFLLGHSQGGMLAPYFVDQGTDVKGIILMAGTPRSLLDILDDQQAAVISAWQAMGLDAQIEAYKLQQEQWRAEREALEGYTAEVALEAEPVYSFPAYYLYTLEQVDNLGLIQSLELPTLILQGSKDWQVYADKDYALYEEALKDAPYATLRLYEGLSHLLMPSSANDLLTAMAEYNENMEIPGQVFEDIASWVLEVRS